jgi:hypothetical protein
LRFRRTGDPLYLIRVENFFVFNKGGTAGIAPSLFWGMEFFFCPELTLYGSCFDHKRRSPEKGAISMTQDKKVTLADALSKLMLTKKYQRGEAIPVTELFAKRQASLQDLSVNKK